MEELNLDEDIKEAWAEAESRILDKIQKLAQEMLDDDKLKETIRNEIKINEALKKYQKARKKKT